MIHIVRFADGMSTLPNTRNAATVAWGFADGQSGLLGAPGAVSATAAFASVGLQSAAAGSVRVRSVATWSTAGLAMAAHGAAIVSGSATFVAFVDWAALAG